MYKNKNFIITVLVVVLLFASYYYFKQDSSVVDIRKFSGELMSVEGNKVTIGGFFVSSSTLPVKLQGQQKLSFVVDEKTQFKKTEIMMPTYESLREGGKTSGSYSLNSLPRMETSGSLEDLKGLVGSNGTFIQVDFAYSIYNKKSPKASFVFYQLLIEPSENI